MRNIYIIKTIHIHNEYYNNNKAYIHIHIIKNICIMKTNKNNNIYIYTYIYIYIQMYEEYTQNKEYIHI